MDLFFSLLTCRILDREQPWTTVGSLFFLNLFYYVVPSFSEFLTVQLCYLFYLKLLFVQAANSFVEQDVFSFNLESPVVNMIHFKTLEQFNYWHFCYLFIWKVGILCNWSVI